MIAPAWASAIPVRALIGAGVVLALAAGVWWHGREQYRAGVRVERAVWVRAQAEAAAQSAENARNRQSIVDAADLQAAARVEIQTQVETKYVDRVREVYRDRDDPVCIDADGMHIIADADRDRAAVARPAGVGAG